MAFVKKHALVLLTLFSLLLTAFVYTQVIFGNKIAFPSNYLVHFFAPYSKEKFPGWEQGIPNKPIGTDLIRFFYPNLTYFKSTASSGQIPFWNPYQFAGNVFMADFQSAIFYPLTWLSLVLPSNWAWLTISVAPIVLATIFMFLYLERLRLSKLAAAFGGFAFGFSGFFLTWTQEATAVAQAAMWLPLLFLGVETNLALTTIAWILSFLAGYLQITFYLTVLLLVYALFRHRLKKTLVALAVGFILVLPQFWSSITAFSLSSRPQVTIDKVFSTYLLPITHLVRLLAPDLAGNPAGYNYFGAGSYNETALFIGLVPFALALLALFARPKDRIVRFFLLGAAGSFFLTSNLPGVRQFLTAVPLVSTFQPSRILILTTFCLSVLAAWGIDHLDKRLLVRILGGFLFLLLAITGVCGYFVLHPRFGLPRNQLPDYISLRNLVMPIGMTIAALIAAWLPKKFLLLALAFLTIFSQLFFWQKYLQVGEKAFLYPSHPIFDFLQSRGGVDRFVAFGAPIMGDLALEKRVFSPEGYDPIFPLRYGTLWHAAKNFGEFSNQISRIEVSVDDLDETKAETIASKPAQLKLLSLLGTKYFFYWQDPRFPRPVSEIFPTETFTSLGRFGSFWGLENKAALPRAFLASNFVVETDAQKELNLVFTTDLHQTIIFEEAPPSWFKAGNETGEAVITTYEPEKVVVETKAETPKILFLSDNFYPDWKVFVDGEKSKIFRADYSFRAVFLPAGQHQVTFLW